MTKFAKWLQITLCVVGVTILPARNGHAGEHDCGPIRNYLGPFDYQDPQSRVPTGADPMGLVKRVENVHFQDEMKALNVKRFGVDRLAGEFAYTLRMFPNHPEALYAMSKLEKLAGGKLPQTSVSGINPFTPKISAYCFFDRAIRFKPEDPHVHYMHAIHLHDRKKLSEARKAYAEAERLGIEGPNFYYNYGLLLTDLKDWETARSYAQKAYAGGFVLEGLRRKLVQAGYPF